MSDENHVVGSPDGGSDDGRWWGGDGEGVGKFQLQTMVGG